MSQGLEEQWDWAKAQLKWDNPPGMSTEQENHRVCLAGRTDFPENSSVLFYWDVTKNHRSIKVGKHL